jgi:hypothetical protein
VIFVWKYGTSPFYFHAQKVIVNRIFSTGSSFLSQLCDSWHTCANVYQRTRMVSERTTGSSSKLLDIFEQVILLWVYNIVEMKYSRRTGTKIWVRLNWSSVETDTVSQLPIATMTLSSNGLGEVIHASCYCDRTHLAVTKHSNGRGDDIGPLLPWPSSTEQSTSHRKIYEINNKVS